MRRGECPQTYYRQTLLFQKSSKLVRCPGYDNKPIRVEEVRNVVEAESMAEETKWIQSRASFLEKSGIISRGRTRMINRMIDGISCGAHCMIMWKYFERLGVTDKGEVKRLADMGRAEPINIGAIGEYAFGIRKEHCDLQGYGKDRASARYLSRMLNAVSEMNKWKADAEPMLVPIPSTETKWPWSSACLVSRALVGREIFSRRISLAMIDHLKQYADIYQKLSGLDGAMWSQQMKTMKHSEFQRLQGLADTGVELAVMANVLCRSIILLDADPPYVTGVFLPFLCEPAECRNNSGQQRSPVVLAWSSKSHHRRVAMVSVTERRSLCPVRLPREWFTSVWGTQSAEETDKMLDAYLHFEQGRWCVVAYGKYFKPEFLRYTVNAFEIFALPKVGVQLSLMAELLDGKMDSGPADLALADDQLWRCVRCEELAPVTAPVRCACCSSRSELRRQRVDGTVEYRSGDHTTIPAPNSWCFLKRKHFWKDVEYDNPPVCFAIQLDVGGLGISDYVTWVSGDSEANLNSNIQQTVAELMGKYGKQVDTVLDEVTDADEKQRASGETELKNTVGQFEIFSI